MKTLRKVQIIAIVAFVVTVVFVVSKNRRQDVAPKATVPTDQGVITLTATAKVSFPQ